MKATVCRAFHAPLSIEELTLAPPGSDEIEVAIAACAVRHSDVSYSEGIRGGVLPAVFGHEATGTVVATCIGVDEFAPGDRVGDFHLALIKHAITWEDGYIHVPAAPGPGIEFDEDLARAHPYSGRELQMQEAPCDYRKPNRLMGGAPPKIVRRVADSSVRSPGSISSAIIRS